MDNTFNFENDIGGYLRKERETQNITLKDLGDRIGLSVQAISQYELGKRAVKYSTFEKIIKVFNMTAPDFLNKYGLYDEQRINRAEPKNQNALYFGMENYIQRLGYIIDGDLAEGYLWIEHDGYQYEINESDLKDLQNSLYSFTNYKLQEIIKKSDRAFKINKKPQKDGES